MKNKTLVGASFLVIGLALGTTLGLKTFSSLGSSSLQQNNATLGVEDYIAQSTCTERSGGCPTNYYWDSGSCSCVYSGPSTCTEPSGGCGSNYYWDSGSCSCVYSPPSNCSEPSGGCGTNYYWDSGLCSCIYSLPASCSNPSGGCGVDWYWDSARCECEPYETNSSSGGETCSEPTGGCGDNYYWDNYSCSCRSSYCSPPSSGCATGEYWDSYSCTCKSSCYPPDGGCGYNSSWDYNSCSCRSSASCSPPSLGCGANYYWDSYYCSCKPYQATTNTSCTSPAAGCGEDYYWDDYSCNCKQYPSDYGCYEPTGGCGYGWHWDDDACSCKSDSDDNVYYSRESYSVYVYDQNFDRLAYESPERINCVKSLLTPTQYERLRYFVPSTNSEQDEIHRLGRKVESCWGSSGSGSGREFVDISATYTSPIEGEQCLSEALGSKAYSEIYKGERNPTYEEHLIFKQCYKGVSSDTITYTTNDQSLPVVTEECLKGVLKGGLYEEIRSGEVDVPFELRDKVDRCFGIDPHPFEEGKSYKIPDDIKSCLLQIVGEDRFNLIYSGASEPTDTERRSTDQCFQRLNADQAVFLPHPPEQVPFLPFAPETIQFVNIFQYGKTARDKAVGGKVVFSGKGPANSTVTIYIYSEPIVVTTKTDENGDWVYELEKPLEGEKHIAYATVRSESGDTVRSSVFDFSVVAADTNSGLQLLQESRVSRILPRFIIYALIVTGIAGVAVIGWMGFVYGKRISLSKGNEDGLSGNSEGDGEGDTGSGSVN